MNYQEKSLNSKLMSEIETIENALVSYEQAEKTLPLPWGNNSYFSATGSYEHDEIDAFWVHGFITQDTVPNKYLSFLPLDPKTGQYYAYGKTLDTNQFEIAWVVYENNVPQTKLVWNYDAINGPYSLIREYNGPEFLRENSRQYFPYNPIERVLTAHIASYSGTITINEQVISNPEEILTYPLREGDNLVVETWWYAEVYYSDGSASYIGEASMDTELVFVNMHYKEENNLITKIQLVLKAGAIWTKASRLDESSQFEVYTTDTTAAVRGTIFGVTKNGSETNVTVIEWEVEIKRNSLWEEDLIEQLKREGEVYSSYPITLWWWVSNIEFDPENYESYISVEAWESPSGISMGEWVWGYNWDIEEEIYDYSDVLDNMNQTGWNTTIPDTNGTANGSPIPCTDSFELNGQCIENNLSDKWWTLVAYAPFKRGFKLHKNPNIYGSNPFIVTNHHDNVSLIQEGGVIVGSWWILKYYISELELEDSFAIEVEVKGEDLKNITHLTTNPPIWYIYSSSSFSTFIKKAGNENIKYSNKYDSTSNISEDSIDINTLIPDKYYSLLSIVEKENVAILRDNEIKDKKSDRDIQSLSEIFIGTDNYWRYRFWTIYSLKIYKK